MGTLAIAAVLLAIGAAAGGKKRGSRPRPPPPPNQGCPPGWIETEDGDCLSMDECDPIDPSTWVPGYVCEVAADGSYELTAREDPMAPEPVDFGTLQDLGGVRSAMNLLGFPYEPLNVALLGFQYHLKDVYGLQSGVDLRTDGRLDTNVILWILTALTDLQADQWYSPDAWAEAQQEAFEEQLAEDPEEWTETVAVLEDQNVAYMLTLWGSDPEGGVWPPQRNDLTAYWFFDDDPNLLPPQGAESGGMFSDWLTNLVYWETYANDPDSIAPRSFFPIPGSDRWESEAVFREAWLRIRDKIRSTMPQLGMKDRPFVF